MAGTPFDQLAQALDGSEWLVAKVEEPQWVGPTTRTDRSVRDLVNHLVGGHRLFAGILQGAETPALADLQRQQGVDQLGEDPAGAYRDAAAGLLVAFRRTGVLEQMVTLPIGPMPGLAALHLRVTETLVHSWDLAQAMGRPAGFPDSLAERQLAFAGQLLADLPPGRAPFAPPQPVPDDAPALDRLAALLGRPNAAPSSRDA